MTTSNNRPVIDYTSRDYAGYRRLMLDAKRELMPEWTSESPNDFGVVLIELFSYVGDILSFYGDRIATEAFLSTAINRASVVDHARMLDYRPNGRAAATVDLEFVSTEPVVVPEGTRVSTRLALDAEESPVYFETTEEVEVDGAAVIPAREGTTVYNEVIGESSGNIDQTFRLDQFPVIDRSVGLEVDEGAGFVEWTPVDRLIEAGNNRNAFTTLEDNQGVITVQFGDGVNGRVPAQGAIIRSTYRVGAGERGNVGTSTLIELHASDAETLAAIISVNNPEAATGGADQESVQSIRYNAPRTLSALHRAVTLDDHANLALRVPGIAKASARQVAYSTVAVYIAPTGTGSTASTEKKNEVQTYLEERKMSNITLFVEDPEFVPIHITVEVEVDSSYNRGQVEATAQRRVMELLDFDAVDFGHFLPVSRVYEVVTKVEGVSFADVSRLDTGIGTGRNNIQLEDLEIPTVGDVEVTATGGILGS